MPFVINNLGMAQYTTVITGDYGKIFSLANRARFGEIVPVVWR
jgi:hypothetical protein